MNKFRGSAFQIILIGLLSFGISNIATAEVKIIYPLIGATVPTSDPMPGNLSSHYTPISFSVVCPGGENTVKWTIDNVLIGQSSFYDQLTMQFIQKLEGGGHHLIVETDNRDCGYAEIKFIVGN